MNNRGGVGVLPYYNSTNITPDKSDIFNNTPRVHVGYELPIIISYPTSESGMILFY